MTEDDRERASQRAPAGEERVGGATGDEQHGENGRGPRDPDRRAAARAASRARRIGGPVSRPAPPSEAEPASQPAPQPESQAESASRAVAPARPEPSPRPGSDEHATGADTPATRPEPSRAGRRRPSPVPRGRADARADRDRERAVRRERLLRWAPATVAAALVIALAIVDVLLLWDWRDRPSEAQQRERIVASVNGGIARVLSYDYRHLDADEQAAAASLTGRFKDQYVTSMNTTIKPKAPAAKAVVVGEVGSTALTSVSGDGKQAVLLVLGQQTVTNTHQKTPRPDPVSLRVTAQLVHGRWLISDLASL